MIEYLRFLKEKSAADQSLDSGLLTAWYMFPEVEQNWLGFSAMGNHGHGLGRTFAEALHTNLGKIFGSFGKEKVTRGSHLEKLCLIRDGVGRDNISDFTNNLIHEFLLDYTHAFAVRHIDPSLRRKVTVRKCGRQDERLSLAPVVMQPGTPGIVDFVRLEALGAKDVVCKHRFRQIVEMVRELLLFDRRPIPARI
jgi:hypothetical protein